MGIWVRRRGNPSSTMRSRGFPPARNKWRNPHTIKGVKPPVGLIVFFELLIGYVGVGLWAPRRHCNNDILWLDIPTDKGDLRNNSFSKTLRIGSTNVLGVAEI